MKLLIFVFFAFTGCQSLKKKQAFCPNPKDLQENCQYTEQPAKVHHISKKEESSQEVKRHLDEPYVSSYGEIEMDSNNKVTKWINYFQNDGRERMALYLSRSTRYIPMMKNVLREYRLPEDLVYVAMIESGFSPRARSFANAVGYWQFIEGTGRRYGLKVDSYVDERRDPVLSTRSAAEYFKDLYGIFASWHLVLASYNAGEYRVNRSVMRYYTRDFWYLTAKKSLPRETANYVPKFIAAVRISKDPAKYGFNNIEYQPPLEYDTVKLEFPVSLKKMAEKMGIEYEEMRKLNPRYRGEYVPVGEETVVRVPVGKKEEMTLLLAECKMSKPKFVYSDYYWYRVRRGDTLYRLARRNRTTISTIRRINKMRSRSILRAGRKIKMPYYNRIVKQRKKYALANSHTVKRGESLNSIAGRYRVKIKKLKALNNLRAGAIIHPGQVLQLTESQQRRPAAQKKSVSIADSSQRFHTVRRGETLIGIAKKYNVSLPSLMKRNSLGFKSTLFAGRRIIIPRQ